MRRHSIAYRVFAAVLSNAAFIGSARAAEPFSWTGLYIGAHAGYAFDGNADYDYTIAGNFEPVGRVRPTDLNGFMGGGHVGFNYQLEGIVLGIEGTLSGGKLGDTLLENPSPAGNDYRTTSEISFLGTVTGRVGLALDRTLIYAKGGYAFTTLDFEAKFFNKDGPGGTNGSVVRIQNDFDRSGWVAGAGIELALTPNWIVGVEYNHMDFGSETVVLPTTNSGIKQEHVRSQFEIDTVMARASYKFGRP